MLLPRDLFSVLFTSWRFSRDHLHPWSTCVMDTWSVLHAYDRRDGVSHWLLMGVHCLGSKCEVLLLGSTWSEGSIHCATKFIAALQWQLSTSH
jgi:hypothetical protein